MRTYRISKALAILVLIGTPVCGHAQEAKEDKPAQIGFPWDWSHQHVVFAGTTNPRVVGKIKQDPRLMHHWLNRNMSSLQRNMVVGTPTPPVPPGARNPREGRVVSGRLRPRTATLKPDWNTNIGTNAAVTAITFPAKWTFDVNATPSCTADYVAYPTGVNGSATQASIVAFNQLYTTQGSVGGLCNANGPSVAWSYINASCPTVTSTDPIKSSPALSFDGTKVAWVTTTGKVQVLTIGTSGANGVAVTLGATIPPAAVCVGGLINNGVLSSVTLNGAPAVTNSAVFVDYTNDVGYVGDDSGKLHKLTPFFNGTLAEVTTGGWPVTVASTTTKILTGPVLDSVSNNIFVGDDEGTAGNLFYVRLSAGSSGACNAGSNGGNPPCLGNTVLAVSTKMGISDPPIVDSSNAWVYTQTPNADGTNAKIYQANTTLGSVSKSNVGGISGIQLHSGAFDNTYFTSGPTNAGARYYVCGLDSAGSSSTLYQFGFSGTTGALNALFTASAAVTSANNSPCSPLTEAYNPNAIGGAADWLFLSVPDHGVAMGGLCSNKPCILQVVITSAPTTVSASQAFKYTPNSGTSGLIIDNVSGSAQASNIYFVPLAATGCTTGGNGACAIKLTQSALN